ncbi:hypothetical protein NA78x_005972 [Anatilimnocola sp. NA78]|uniref:hypothetical protein n=1 Tax=Anatilimnocola sp. NA78 TaxID=3415683 RepID=UPI003CE5302E
MASHLISIAGSVAIDSFEFGCSPDSLDDKYGEPHAHCTAIQINRNEYDKGGEAQKRIKGWMEKVSALITAEDIIGPHARPSDDVPYRPYGE